MQRLHSVQDRRPIGWYKQVLILPWKASPCELCVLSPANLLYVQPIIAAQERDKSPTN